MPYIGQRPSKGDENNFKILDNISSYTLTFDGSDSSVVSDANDTITSLTHRFVQGQRVTYNNGGGSNIGGLTDGTVYFIIKEDHNTIKLATSASNASNGVVVPINGVGGGSSHTLNVAFDGVNTKFKATHTNGQKARITRAAQLVISINGVIQQPHDTATPSTGFGFDLDGTIVFSQAPVSTDEYWAHVLTNNNVTFDISDNDIDNFTGDGSTVSFNLSKSPPDNRNILVTVDGVVQYPNDPDGTERSYTVVENVLTFSVAPALGTEVQVRHIGFAGSTSGGGSGGVTSFYGRTGAVVLKSTDNITVNDAAITGNATVTGDLTVNGTTTTLDTKLVEVDKIEVETESTNVAIAVTHNGSGDLIRLYDGSKQVVTVDDEGKVGIGTATPTVELDIEGAQARIHLHDYDGSMAQLIQSGNGFFLNVDAEGNGSGSLQIRVGGNTGTSEKLRITSDGKVGIGTNSPRNNSKLDVLSPTSSGVFINYDGQSNTEYGLRIESNVAGGNFESDFLNGTTALLDLFANSSTTSGGDLLVARTQSSNPVFLVKGNGKVGIGTDDPATHLHLFGTDANLQFRVTKEGVGSFNHGVDTVGAFLETLSGDNIPIRFFTGGSEKLRINSSGDVSIGSTADALRRVDVVGNSILVRPTSITTLHSSGNANAVNNSIIIRMPYGENAATTANAGARFGIQFTGANNTTDITSLNFGDDPVKSASIYGVSEDVLGYNRKVGMVFYTSSFDAAQQERLRITNDGKVGIGTSNPDTLLEIYNSSTSGNTALKVHNDKAGDAAQLMLEGGRTSINDCAQVIFANRGNLVSGIIANSAADDGNLTFRTSASGSNSALTTYGHIAKDGKVKFGKNAGGNPGARFHVEDDSTTAYDPDSTTAAASVYLVNTGTDGPMGMIFQNASTDGSNTCQATIHSVAESTNKDTALTFGTRQNSDATIRERLRIDSSGKIGINRAATEHPLEIGHASSPTQSFWRGSTKGFAISAESAGTYLMSYQNAPLIFSVNSGSSFSEKLRILSSGEIGIGITNPTKTGIQNLVKVLQIDGGDGAELILGNSQSSNVSANHIGAIAFKNIDNSVSAAPNYAGIRCNATDTVGNMNLKFYAGSTAFESDEPHMTIISSGKIGIGSDNPQKNLDIYTGQSHSSLRLHNLNNGGTGYDSELSLLGSASNSEMRINMGVNSDPDREQIKSYQSDLMFKTATDERFRITSGGTVSVISHNFAIGNPDDNVAMQTVTKRGFLGAGSNATLSVGTAYAGGRIIAHCYKTADSTKQKTYYADFQARGTGNGYRTNERTTTQNSGVNFSVTDDTKGFKITNNETFTIKYAMMIEIVGDIPVD